MPGKIDTSSPTIGEMLGNAVTYRVPTYQRDFSWSDDEIGQFWLDLKRARSFATFDYFLGSMVVSEDAGGKVINVIDGQQRLTTLSLLLTALRDLLKEAHQEREATKIEDGFLGTYDWEAKKDHARLELNKTNKIFYSQVILSGDPKKIDEAGAKKVTHPSNKLMAKAYMFFRKRLGEEVSAGIALDKLVSEIVHVAKFKLSLIRIAVKSDYDAYLLFETLNDRGLELTVADLLKNYIFQQASSSPHTLSLVEKNWEEMIRSLKAAEPKKFLRHFWLSNYEVIRDKDLYGAVTKQYAGSHDVMYLSQALLDAAHYYGSFEDVDSDWWGDFDASDQRSIRTSLEELKLFRITQCYPLLLAVIEKAPQLFPRVLRMVISFSFRYSIIGGRSSNSLEQPFSDAALSLRGTSDPTFHDVFSHLQALYPDDQEFKKDFGEREILSGPLARYILVRINDDLARESGLKTIDNPDIVNLEHILPRKFDQKPEWIAAFGMPEEEVAQFVNRIGNLTLLRSSLNRKLQNETFGKKLTEYKKQPLQISESVVSQSEWNGKTIEDRQLILAKLAAKIWRVD